MLITLSNCGIRDKFTFYPDQESKIPEQNIPNYVTERSIRTRDNQNLQAFLFRHNDNINRSLIIYFHGNAGNIYHRFDDATKLFDMNRNVLLVSYRGYSKSTGKPNEKGIYIDGESTVNYAIDSLGYDEKDITIFGRSLGTTVAIHISQNRNFNSLILVTPLTSGKEMATAMGLGFIRFIAGKSYNSIEKIKNIKSRILIIHGDKDEVIPYYMGKKLFDTFNGVKYIITIREGGHNDLQDVDSQLFWGGIEKFLNSGCKKTPISSLRSS